MESSQFGADRPISCCDLNSGNPENAPKPLGSILLLFCDAESRASFESTSEEEYVESTKPTFYPHSFKERESEFDVDSFLRGNVMDRIQEDRFKGFYNFTFIYLIATVTMLVVFFF